jgi:hypothetical protein
MPAKKYSSSEDRSNERTRDPVKDKYTTKQKEPYGSQRPQTLGGKRQVHEEIIARRMEGGAPPSPEAYALALEQWHRLPGSVMRPPTDVLSAAKKSKPPDAGYYEHRP